MRDRGTLIDRIGSLLRPDPSLAPVKEWLEIEQAERHRRAFRLLAQIGVCLLVGVLGAVLVTGLMFVLAPRALQWEAELTLTVLLSLGSAGALVGFVGLPLARRMPAHEMLPYGVREAMDEIEAHAYGRRLRSKLGEDGYLVLSEGAALYLRCRSALTSDAWSGSNPSDPWEAARRDLLRATEATMGRLAQFVVKRRTFAETTDLLEQLRHAANEAERATLARSTGLTASGRDIRASLARFQELSAAEDELLRIRE